MSPNLVANLRASVANADDDMADAIADAQHTGERPDLDDWHVEVPVEWLREAADRIEALEAADAWLPIETAPQNGTLVDLWTTREERVPDAHYSQQKGAWLHWSMGEFDSMSWCRVEGTITHWRVLPAPPASAKEDG